MVKLTETLVLARSRASDLDSVRKLNCWGSDITDVGILKRLTNVQIVSLSVNSISTLDDFSHCQNLEELYIRKNTIKDLSEICHLKKLPKLTKLWLADNPCAESEKYRLTVLKTLPNLNKLDNITVSEDEVNQALDEGLDLSLPEKCDHSMTVPSPSSGANQIPPKETGATSEGEDGKSVETVKVDQSSDTGASGDASSKPECSDKDSSVSTKKLPTNPVMISWDETNVIRQQLGLKPLPVEKVTRLKPRPSISAKDRNANLLQAVLHLVKELDAESLEVVSEAVTNRLDVL